MSVRRLLAVAILAVAATVPAYADPILDESGPLFRSEFDTNFWCPINFYWVSSFVADGPDVTVQFVAQNLGNLPPLSLRQRIDNVAVLERSVYEANLGPSTVGMKDIFCLNVGDEVFFFQDVAPGDFVFFDQFASGPAPGWDLTDGAFYVDNSIPGASAPNDLRNPVPDPTGGSLGLGAEGNMASTVGTQITIEGLTGGTEYVLTFWWRSRADTDDYGVPFPDPDLQVTICGSGAVPVRSATWGAIKAAFAE